MLFTHKYWNELCVHLTNQSDVVSVDQYINTPSDNINCLLQSIILNNTIINNDKIIPKFIISNIYYIVIN